MTRWRSNSSAPPAACPPSRPPSTTAPTASTLGFKDATNARNFTGLNFDDAQPARRHPLRPRPPAKVLLALNTYPADRQLARWTAAVDKAADFGVDAIILADPGLMAYARKTKHPQLRLHLSVQGSATSYEAINFYHERFGIQRAVLPRVLSMAQVEQRDRQHAGGDRGLRLRRPLRHGGGALRAVRLRHRRIAQHQRRLLAGQGGALGADARKGMETRLNGILIDRFADGEKTGYPTLCKGRFEVNDETYYAIEEPTSLNTLELLPELARIGHSRHQDRGPPAQPGLRRPGHQGVARGHRRACWRNRQRFRVRRPGWPS
jgi:collagenase-like PrtC family protease